MEELEKVPKELKGSATLKVEQQCELTSTPCLPELQMYQKMAWLAISGKRGPLVVQTLYVPQYRGTPGPRSGSGWGSIWGTFGIALEM